MRAWETPRFQFTPLTVVLKNTVFLPPHVRPVVYLAPGQREATFQQELEAIREAYVQAAKRGEVGMIRLGEREGK